MPPLTARSLLLSLIAALPLRRAAPPSEAGRMAPCPATANCVSTRATRPAQLMPPIAFEGSPADAIARLRRLLAAMPRVRIVEDDGGYVHAEFRTAVFHFVDDVEFEVDGAARVIHFRSASRLGRSDFGTNRRRMSDLTRRFAAAR
jgi:uncharacterized protein (DUF1499 family)